MSNTVQSRISIKQLYDALAVALREVKDVYCRAYLEAIPRANLDYGFEGTKVQILYAFTNMGTWRGETARATKAVIKSWLKQEKAI